MEVKRFDKPVNKSMIVLKEGDVFEWNSLGEVAFVRFKRGGQSFVATQLSTDQNYSCRAGFGFYNNRVDIIGEVIKDTRKDEKKKLKPGTLFVIDHRKDAVLLQFVSYTSSGKIKAINPLSGAGFTIDSSFDITLLKTLQKSVTV